MTQKEFFILLQKPRTPSPKKNKSSFWIFMRRSQLYLYVLRELDRDIHNDRDIQNHNPKTDPELPDSPSYINIKKHRDLFQALIFPYWNLSLQNDNRTPLMYACWNGYTDIARLLIEKGADLDAQDTVEIIYLCVDVCN